MFLVSNWHGHAELATTARHHADVLAATLIAELVKGDAACRRKLKLWPTSCRFVVFGKGEKGTPLPI
jgi:hypothetical protein